MYQYTLVTYSLDTRFHALFSHFYCYHYCQGLLNRHIAVRTAWLTAVDYALLLRCADLGNYPPLYSSLYYLRYQLSVVMI